MLATETIRTAPVIEGELEIRPRTGPAWRQPLHSDRMVIGRAVGAAILIDHRTVSRRHAEVYRDPFGRWRIRDLGSRFGTHVDGVPVEDHSLTGRETIQIGEFAVRFVPRTRAPDTGAFDLTQTLAIEEDGVSAYTTLPAHAPPRIAADQLKRLMELGHALTATADSPARLRCLCDGFVALADPADAVFALRISTEQPEEAFQTLVASFRDGEHPERAPHISRTLLRRVVAMREPMLAGLPGVSSVDLSVSIATHLTGRAALACPLLERGSTIDVMYVVLNGDAGAEEWLALASLAAAQYQAAEEAWQLRESARAHEMIEQELARARDIQSRLLPRIVARPGYAVCIGFQRCLWVGGDYVDVVPLGRDRLLLTLGDVCGKGLAAAMTTGNLHAIVHAYADDEHFGLERLIGTANRYFAEHLLDDSFVTLLCSVLDCRSGELTTLSAGHPGAIVIDRNGRLRPLDMTRVPPLGLIEARSLPPAADTLAPGEWLLLYSDGVTDLCNEQGQRLELEGLQTVLHDLFTPNTATGAATATGNGDLEPDRQPPFPPSHIQSAADAVRALTQRLDQFQGRGLPADDRTFLVVRRT